MTVLRVLIAEDEYVSATLLELMVTEEGHEVCGIINQGSAVTEAVRELHPDVVLMDVHLADDTSGIAATRDLLRQVHVPVIVISATDNPEELAAIAECGALGYIKKPISADEIHVSLRIAVHHNAVMRRLRDSEFLHRSLFDNAAVGIYLCHKDGYFLACNHAFASMLGYSGPAELLRLMRSMDDQLYAEPGRRQELLALLGQGKELKDAESLVFGRDGDAIWISEHLAPHFDADGNLTEYEGVVINVSDKKKAESELKLAHTLMRNTMDAISDFVVVTDLDGNIVIANRSFEETFAENGEVPDVLDVLADVDEIWSGFQDEFKRNGATATCRGSISIAGSASCLDTSISPFLTPDGELMGAVFVMRPHAEKE